MIKFIKGNPFVGSEAPVAFKTMTTRVKGGLGRLVEHSIEALLDDIKNGAYIRSVLWAPAGLKYVFVGWRWRMWDDDEYVRNGYYNSYTPSGDEVGFGLSLTPWTPLLGKSDEELIEEYSLDLYLYDIGYSEDNCSSSYINEEGVTCFDIHEVEDGEAHVLWGEDKVPRALILKNPKATSLVARYGVELNKEFLTYLRSHDAFREGYSEFTLVNNNGNVGPRKKVEVGGIDLTEKVKGLGIQESDLAEFEEGLNQLYYKLRRL